MERPRQQRTRQQRVRAARAELDSLKGDAEYVGRVRDRADALAARVRAGTATRDEVRQLGNLRRRLSHLEESLERRGATLSRDLALAEAADATGRRRASLVRRASLEAALEAAGSRGGGDVPPEGAREPGEGAGAAADAASAALREGGSAAARAAVDGVRTRGGGAVSRVRARRLARAAARPSVPWPDDAAVSVPDAEAPRPSGMPGPGPARDRRASRLPRAEGATRAAARRSAARRAAVSPAAAPPVLPQASRLAGAPRRVALALRGAWSSLVRAAASWKGAAVLGGAACLVVLSLPFVAAVGMAPAFSVLANEAHSRSSVGSLVGTEAAAARALRGLGYGDVQIAAILGNGACEGQPDTDANMDGRFEYAYERAVGMFQYTHASNEAPPSDSCECEYCSYKRWAAGAWASVDKQVEWTFSEDGGGYWRGRWQTGLAANGYYLGDCGVPADMGFDASAEDFMAESSLERATYSWMACYERPADYACRYDARLEEARRILAALRTPSAGASVANGDVVAAALRIATLPTSYNRDYGIGDEDGSGVYTCSGLVYRAYADAGIDIPMSQNMEHAGEDTQAWAVWTHEHVEDVSQAKPGWIIVFGTSIYHTQHVAIYVGDGMMVDALPYRGVSCHPVSEGVGIPILAIGSPV